MDVHICTRQANMHEEPQSGAENETLLELEGFNSSDRFSYSSSQPGKATTLNFQEDDQKIEVWPKTIFSILSKLIDQGFKGEDQIGQIQVYLFMPEHTRKGQQG